MIEWLKRGKIEVFRLRWGNGFWGGGDAEVHREGWGTPRSAGQWALEEKCKESLAAYLWSSSGVPRRFEIRAYVHGCWRRCGFIRGVQASVYFFLLWSAFWFWRGKYGGNLPGGEDIFYRVLDVKC